MPIKRAAVIYLQKDRLQLYLSETTNVIEMVFPRELVRDLDIVDKQNFEMLIKAFLTANTIPAADYTIVIADNAAFIRDFSQPPPVQPQSPQEAQAAQNVFQANLHTLINTYIEHVPFEHVVSKTFPIKNGTRVFASNRDLYDDIQIVLEKEGSSVSLILPAFITGVFANKPGLDVAAATYLLQHTNALKQYDLTEVPMFTAETHENKQEKEIEESYVVPQTNKKPDKKRLYVLVCVFAFLIVILVIMVIANLSQLSPSAEKTVRVQSAQSAVTPIPPTPTTSIPSQPVASAPNDLDTASLSVSILSSTATAAQSVATLRSYLGQYKFKSVTTGTQTGVTSPITLVTFSSKPSNAVRAAILEQVRKVSSNLSVQDKPDATDDISILLGQ
jgi:hypothetical protein